MPEKFWDSYVEDARAALSLTSIAGAYSAITERSGSDALTRARYKLQKTRLIHFLIELGNIPQ